MRLFDTVLVANRGEIAVRVLRTLRRLGIRSIAVYSDADRTAAHVHAADVAVHLGASPAGESYLHVERIVRAAQRTGAQAIHPGYGFLSEKPEFARACAERGIVFIGPSATAITEMGNKIRAREVVAAAGVEVVPGRSDPDMSDDDLCAAAEEIGFPVLLKPAAGGGGKGMRVVTAEGELREQLAAARRESRASFGDDSLLVERYVPQPRHIEVQVLGDQHGTVRHLGERECSLQRRHQKIIEEAPSPLLDPAARHRIGQAAVDVARTVEYVGAGTVEFVVPAERPDEFFFLEMNTRLQVEHPVTELVAGTRAEGAIDLVEQQLRIAAGAALSWSQGDLLLNGHAVEARVYAEDPRQDFLPTGGEVRALHEPAGARVRVDSGVRTGTVVGTDYDPMISKVIAWAPERDEALSGLDAALADTAVLGVSTNIAFLRALLNDANVRSGQLDTRLVDRFRDELSSSDVPDEVYIAVALERLHAAEPSAAVEDPWDVPSGWRLGAPAWTVWRFAEGAAETRVYLRGRAHDAVAVVENPDATAVDPADPGAAAPQHAASSATASPNTPEQPERAVSASVSVGADELSLTLAEQTRCYRFARAGGTTWLAAGGAHWAVTERELLSDGAQSLAATDGSVVSPMPGTVLNVDVEPGQWVASGKRLFVVEAMKMEHTVVAPFDGQLAEVHVRPGESVRLEHPLAVLKPAEEA